MVTENATTPQKDKPPIPLILTDSMSSAMPPHPPHPPSPSAKKKNSRLRIHLRHSHHRFFSWLALLASGGFFLWILFLALLAHWILPNCAAWFPSVTAFVYDKTKVRIETQGIRGELISLNPRLTFDNLRIYASPEAPAIHIKKLEAELDWEFFWRLSPHFQHFAIDGLSIELVRNSMGHIVLSGLEDEEKYPIRKGDNITDTADMLNWLTVQNHVLIKNATINWRDDFSVPTFRTTLLAQMSLTQRWLKHTMILELLPSDDIAQFIRFDGRFTGFDAHQLGQAEGEISLSLNNAKWAQLLYFLPEGQKMRGQSSAMLWLKGRGLMDSKMVLDINTEQLEWQPLPLSVEQAQGRIIGRIRNHELRLNTSQFLVQTNQGPLPWPTQLDITISPHFLLERLEAAIPSASLSAARKMLGQFIQWFPEVETINHLNPQGFIKNASLLWLNQKGEDLYKTAWPSGAIGLSSSSSPPSHSPIEPIIRFSGDLVGVGWNAFGDIPGVQGLDAHMKITTEKERSSEILLDSHNLVINVPKIMHIPVHRFDRLQGRVVWEYNTATPPSKAKATSTQEDYTLHFHDIMLANPHGTAKVEGYYQQKGDTPYINLTGSLLNADGTQVWRYMPKEVDISVSHWLKESITGGISPLTQLILKGDLRRFPFKSAPTNHLDASPASVKKRARVYDERFEVVVPFKNATLKFHPDWPSVESASGLLVFLGQQMEITVHKGFLEEADAQKTKVFIHDLDKPLLEIQGIAKGMPTHFKNFMLHSPLRDIIPGLPEAQAEGEAELTLNLNIPLTGDIEHYEVNGTLISDFTRLSLDPTLPDFTQVHSRAHFDKNGLISLAANGLFMNTPFTLIPQEVPRDRNEAISTLSLNQLTMNNFRASSLGAHPWFEGIDGAIDINGHLNIAAKGFTVHLKGDGKGLQSNLPAPFNKDKNIVWPWWIDIKNHEGLWGFNSELRTPATTAEVTKEVLVAQPSSTPSQPNIVEDPSFWDWAYWSSSPTTPSVSAPSTIYVKHTVTSTEVIQKPLIVSLLGQIIPAGLRPNILTAQQQWLLSIDALDAVEAAQAHKAEQKKLNETGLSLPSSGMRLIINLDDLVINPWLAWFEKLKGDRYPIPARLALNETATTPSTDPVIGRAPISQAALSQFLADSQKPPFIESVRASINKLHLWTHTLNEVNAVLTMPNLLLHYSPVERLMAFIGLEGERINLNKKELHIDFTAVEGEGQLLFTLDQSLKAIHGNLKRFAISAETKNDASAHPISSTNGLRQDLPDPLDEAFAQKTTRYHELPAIDFNIKEFSLPKVKLGEVWFKGHLDTLPSTAMENEPPNYIIDLFKIQNGQNIIEAKGKTYNHLGLTQLNFTCTMPDLGDYLAKNTPIKYLDNGTLKGTGIMEWTGGVFDFSAQALRAEGTFDIEKGRLLDIDPGVGRLLGLLNLQTLLRRISLDFSDALKDGFSFDKIHTRASIKNMVVRINKSVVESPAARILMDGSLNLQKETQKIEMVVLPNISGGVASGVAFFINPVTGVVTWLAQKAINSPFDHIFGKKFIIEGDWAKPITTEVNYNPIEEASTPSIQNPAQTPAHH